MLPSIVRGDERLNIPGSFESFVEGNPPRENFLQELLGHGDGIGDRILHDVEWDAAEPV